MSKRAEFTPWTLCEYKADDYHEGSVLDENGEIITAWRLGIRQARLIAAAPELLAEAKRALDVLVNQFSMDCEGVESLRLTIAKTEGADHE